MFFSEISGSLYPWYLADEGIEPADVEMLNIQEDKNETGS